MSLKKVETALKGYKQVFPKGIEELTRAYYDPNMILDGAMLNEIMRKIEGFLPPAMHTPVTADGYEWFWGYNFRSGDDNNKIAVLFPWGQDWKKQDNTTSERCIGVYIRGKVEMPAVESLLDKLQEGLVNYKAKRNSNPFCK